MDCLSLGQRTIFRGDSDVFTVNFNDDNGDPVNITDYEVRYTVRLTEPATDDTNDTDATISAVATIPVGTDGKAEFNVPPEDTNIEPLDYYYDIQYTKPSGYNKTVGKGLLVVKADITRDL